ncbi:unnamed protein product [Amoebophrya sp. A120]|nr:unnamed protein product [Amoebophrya sp. A120]|eukprot:GSA120T00015349001.1
MVCAMEKNRCRVAAVLRHLHISSSLFRLRAVVEIHLLGVPATRSADLLWYNGETTESALLTQARSEAFLADLEDDSGPLSAAPITSGPPGQPSRASRADEDSTVIVAAPVLHTRLTNQQSHAQNIQAAAKLTHPGTKAIQSVSFVQQSGAENDDQELDRALIVLKQFKPIGEAPLGNLSHKERLGSLLARGFAAAKQTLQARGVSTEGLSVNTAAANPVSELMRLARRVDSIKQAGGAQGEKKMAEGFAIADEYFNHAGPVFDDNDVDRATLLAFEKLSRLYQALKKKRAALEGMPLEEKLPGKGLSAVAARLADATRDGNVPRADSTIQQVVTDIDSLAFRLLREVIVPRTLRMVQVALDDIVPAMGIEKTTYEEKMKMDRKELESLFRLQGGAAARDTVARLNRDKTRRKEIWTRVREIEEEVESLMQECVLQTKQKVEDILNVIDTEKPDIERVIIEKFATEEENLDTNKMTMDSVPKFLRDKCRVLTDEIQATRADLSNLVEGATSSTGKIKATAPADPSSAESFLEEGEAGKNGSAALTSVSLSDAEKSGEGGSTFNNPVEDLSFRERVDKTKEMALRTVELKSAFKTLQKVSTMSSDGALATMGLEELENTIVEMTAALRREREGLRSVVEQTRSYVASAQAERDSLVSIKAGLTQLSVPIPYQAFREDVVGSYFRLADCSMCVLSENRSLTLNGFPFLCENPSRQELVRDGLENIRFLTPSWCLLHCAAQSDLSLDNAVYQQQKFSAIAAGPASCVEMATVFSDDQCGQYCEMKKPGGGAANGIDPLSNAPNLRTSLKFGSCQVQKEYADNEEKIQKETGNIFGADVRVPIRWYDRLMQMHAACNHCYLRNPLLCYPNEWFASHIVDIWVPSSTRPVRQRGPPLFSIVRGGGGGSGSFVCGFLSWVKSNGKRRRPATVKESAGGLAGKCEIAAEQRGSIGPVVYSRRVRAGVLPKAVTRKWQQWRGWYERGLRTQKVSNCMWSRAVAVVKREGRRLQAIQR